MALIFDITGKTPSVVYTVQIEQGPDGVRKVHVLDVADTPRDRESVIFALRHAASILEGETATYCDEGDGAALYTMDQMRDYADAFHRSRIGAAKGNAKPCSLGVGCEESGVCYAEAHGEPSRCGRIAAPEVTADEARESVPDLFKSSLTPFGMLIRALRIVANKTLGDMAKFAHMSSADLSNVEMGRKPLTDDLAIIAAEYFHSLGIVGTLPAIYAALAAQNGETES